METGAHVQSRPQPHVGYEFPKVARVQVDEFGLSFGGDARLTTYPHRAPAP